MQNISIINCQDYLYQEMELGEHKNGNHSSGGQGQGGTSKPSPDPVGNVHWGPRINVVGRGQGVIKAWGILK